MTRTEHIDGTQLAPFNRPRTGRVLAGVALAVATRLELPLWVIRLSFVILVGFGGVGILLYLAGWALIPAEGDTRAVAGRFLDRIEGPRAWIGVGLMALAAVVVAESSRILDADIVVAGILVLVGVLLYRGDIGSPRSSTQEERTNMPSTYSTLAAEGDSTLTGGEPTLTGGEPTLTGGEPTLT
ncbi:MAG: PspC domain-containing protein, partial [Acidimicrobiia bacterium]|nr:PspC domain-containing protein [Acidimicrobiia bacterium]